MADEGPKTASRRGRLALHAGALAAAAIGVACLTSTRHTLSGTFDEGNHLAAGLEWWQFGSYTMWTENPPLPRLAIAALPYLHGMRLPAPADWDPKTHDWDRSWEVGTDLLYAGDGFEANLARARLGTLPLCASLPFVFRREPERWPAAAAALAAPPLHLARVTNARRDRGELDSPLPRRSGARALSWRDRVVLEVGGRPSTWCCSSSRGRPDQGPSFRRSPSMR